MHQGHRFNVIDADRGERALIADMSIGQMYDGNATIRHDGQDVRVDDLPESERDARVGPFLGTYDDLRGRIMTDLQNALKAAGFDPGPADGQIGARTMRAVDDYQRANGMERGGLTLTTLEALGVKI